MRKTSLTISGRLCLFGEHTDWVSGYRRINSAINPGRAIVCLVDLNISADIEKKDDFSFYTDIKSLGVQCNATEDSINMSIVSNPYFAYVLSTYLYIYKKYQVKGLKIQITTNNLYIGKGLGSSAAICILVARAFNNIYNLRMSIEDEIEAAYWGGEKYEIAMW